MNNLSRYRGWLILSLLAASTGCLATPEETAEAAEDAPVAESRDALFGNGNYWPMNAVGDTEVPVCWLAPGWTQEKAWVKEAVEAQWGAYSSVKFIGWGDCGACDPM